MFTSQYEEHLQSQPDASRWDGFDRGDIGQDNDNFGRRVLSSSKLRDGRLVEVVEFWSGYDSVTVTFIDGVES